MMPTLRLSVEIERCVKREKTYELSEQDRFFELLKYIFAVDVDGEANQFVLRKSSLLTLIDMVLNPERWPYYASNKARLIELLLPRQDNLIQANEVEAIIKNYFEQVNKDFHLLHYCYYVTFI